MLAAVTQSIIPEMDQVYTQDFAGKVNSRQKEFIQFAKDHQAEKLRIMTFNMLYNLQAAEDRLPTKHRWENRKLRLLEYLGFAQADIIGSQELQQDQVQELMQVLGKDYAYYGEKTREKEGRSDINAIFFNQRRLALIEAKTILYEGKVGKNAFTYCYFKDKLINKNLVVINTKLTWASVERRLTEATELRNFVRDLNTSEAIIVTGDFNTYPFIEQGKNIFLDGYDVEHVLTEYNLKDTINKSIFGHFGPFCTITHAKKTMEPFVGAELTGFMLDHILVNDRLAILAHGVDTARVNNEFPSDHFPVIVDLNID